MTKEQRRATMERIELMRTMLRDSSEQFVVFQEMMVEAHSCPSPADAMYMEFEPGTAGRDEAARVMLQLAMTCLAMLSLDLMAEETAKMN